MKVIGESENGYIITATKDEIANLQGLYSHYSDGFNVDVGDELNIKPFYDMAKEANSMRSRRNELESVANHIDSALRIIDFVTKSTGKEQES